MGFFSKRRYRLYRQKGRAKKKEEESEPFSATEALFGYVSASCENRPTMMRILYTLEHRQLAVLGRRKRVSSSRPRMHYPGTSVHPAKIGLRRCAFYTFIAWEMKALLQASLLHQLRTTSLLAMKV